MKIDVSFTIVFRELRRLRSETHNGVPRPNEIPGTNGLPGRRLNSAYDQFCLDLDDPIEE